MQKRLNFFLILIVFSFASNLFAQGEANIWYFGDHAGLDFNGGAPVALTDGALNTPEGCAAISNSSGALLFYTDGVTVWNKQHHPMPNGTGLMGDGSSTQSALIVPKPGVQDIYYVFTTSAFTSTINECNYSEIDMTLSGGMGDVTYNKNISLSTNSSEKLCAVKKENNFDYWVIAHELNSSVFLVYSITSAGVNTSPVTSNAGSIVPKWGIGYLKASVNGRNLAQAIYGQSGAVDVLKFNNYTGIISDNFSIQSGTAPYGVEFSPDGTRLYETTDMGMFIYQFDLTLGSSAAIIASSTIIIPSDTINYHYDYALQLGPDGKIYVANFGNFLSCINNPNALGSACGFVDFAIDLLGRTSNFSLPNFISSCFSSCSA